MSWCDFPNLGTDALREHSLAVLEDIGKTKKQECEMQVVGVRRP